MCGDFLCGLDIVMLFFVFFVKDKKRYILFSLFDSVKDQIKNSAFLQPKTIIKVILSPAKLFPPKNGEDDQEMP